MVMSWFRCIAEAIAHKGLRGILQEVPGGAWLYDVSSDAYQRMRERGQDERIRAADRQECESQAKAEYAAIEVQMAELAAEVIPNEPPETQRALADYLSIIPARMKQAFARPEDPTGTTVPADWLIERPEDVSARNVGIGQRTLNGSHRSSPGRFALGRSDLVDQQIDLNVR